MKESVRLWLEALRSGQYAQGKEHLLKDGRYCCLGVACSIYQKVNGNPLTIKTLPKTQYRPEGVVAFYRDGIDDPEEKDLPSFLPPDVQKWLGLSSKEGTFEKATPATEYKRKLWELNDMENWTFEQLANFIESNPEGLFEPEVVS